MSEAFQAAEAVSSESRVPAWTPPEPSIPALLAAAETVRACYLRFCRALPKNGGPGGETAEEAYDDLDNAIVLLCVVSPFPEIPDERENTDG